MRAMLVLLSIVAISTMDSSRIIGTEATMRQLATSVRQFKAICGRLPIREEGLEVLIHEPPDWPAQVPWSPFLETTQIPRDGWNKDFTYVLDPELAEGFGIYSCGYDGISSSNGNDRDDLNTWRRRHWLGYYDHWISRMDMPSSVIGLGIILLIAAALVQWWKISKSP
jgi:hypothetical protein